MGIYEFFDIDASLTVDPDTKDLKELYNDQAVNQAIDIFISNPYRIGVGTTNRIFDMVFNDVRFVDINDLTITLEDNFKRGFNLIAFNEIIVIPQPNKKRYRITLNWFIPNTDISGTYDRYWNQPT